MRDIQEERELLKKYLLLTANQTLFSHVSNICQSLNQNVDEANLAVRDEINRVFYSRNTDLPHFTQDLKKRLVASFNGLYHTPSKDVQSKLYAEINEFMTYLEAVIYLLNRSPILSHIFGHYLDPYRLFASLNLSIPNAADLYKIARSKDILKEIANLDYEGELKNLLASYEYLYSGDETVLDRSQYSINSRITLALINDEPILANDLQFIKNNILFDTSDQKLGELHLLSSDFIVKHNPDAEFIVEEQDKPKLFMKILGLIEGISFVLKQDFSYVIILAECNAIQRELIIKYLKLEVKNPSECLANIKLSASTFTDWAFYVRSSDLAIIPITKDEIMIYYTSLVRIFSHNVVDKLLPQLDKIYAGLSKNDKDELYGNAEFKKIWHNNTDSFLRLSSNNERTTYGLSKNLYAFSKARNITLSSLPALRAESEDLPSDILQKLSQLYNCIVIKVPNEATLLYADQAEGFLSIDKNIVLKPGSIVYIQGVKEYIKSKKALVLTPLSDTRKRFSELVSDLSHLPHYSLLIGDVGTLVIDPELENSIFLYNDKVFGSIKIITKEKLLEGIYAAYFFQRSAESTSAPASASENETSGSELYRKIVIDELSKYELSKKDYNIILTEFYKPEYFQKITDSISNNTTFNVSVMNNLLPLNEKLELFRNLHTVMTHYLDVLEYFVRGNIFFSLSRRNQIVEVDQSNLFGVKRDISKKFPALDGINIEYNAQTECLSFSVIPFHIDNQDPNHGIRTLNDFLKKQLVTLNEARKEYDEVNLRLKKLEKNITTKQLLKLMDPDLASDKRKDKDAIKQEFVACSTLGIKSLHPKKNNDSYFLITDYKAAKISIDSIEDMYAKKRASEQLERETIRQKKILEKKKKIQEKWLAKEVAEKQVEEVSPEDLKIKREKNLHQARELFKEICQEHRETIEYLTGSSDFIIKTKNARAFLVHSLEFDEDIEGLSLQCLESGNIVSVSERFLENNGRGLNNYFLKKSSSRDKAIRINEEKRQLEQEKREHYEKFRKELKEGCEKLEQRQNRLRTWYDLMRSEKILLMLNMLKLEGEIFTAPSEQKVIRVENNNGKFDNVGAIRVPQCPGINLNIRGDRAEFVITDEQAALEENGGVQKLEQYADLILERMKKAQELFIAQTEEKASTDIQRVLRGRVVRNALNIRKKEEATINIQRIARGAQDRARCLELVVDNSDDRMKQFLSVNQDNLNQILENLPLFLKRKIAILDGVSTKLCLKGGVLYRSLIELSGEPNDIDFEVEMVGLAHKSKTELQRDFSEMLGVPKEAISIYNKKGKFTINIKVGKHIDIVIHDRDRPINIEQDWATNLDAIRGNIKGKINISGKVVEPFTKTDLFFAEGYQNFFAANHRKFRPSKDNMLDYLLRNNMDINKKGTSPFTRPCLAIAFGFADLNKKVNYTKLLKDELSPSNANIRPESLLEKLKAKLEKTVEGHGMLENRDLHINFYKVMRSSFRTTGNLITKYLDQTLEELSRSSHDQRAAKDFFDTDPKAAEDIPIVGDSSNSSTHTPPLQSILNKETRKEGGLEEAISMV